MQMIRILLLVLLLTSCSSSVTNGDAPPSAGMQESSLSVDCESSRVPLPASGQVDNSSAEQETVDQSSGLPSSASEQISTALEYHHNDSLMESDGNLEYLAGANTPMYDQTVLNTLVLPTEILNKYSLDNVVIYTKYQFLPPIRNDEWQAWLQAYRDGKEYSVLTYLYADGFPFTYYELVCDGTQQYTINQYPQWDEPQVFRSSQVAYNDFLTIFAHDLPDVNFFEVGSGNTIIYSKPMELAVLPYEITSNDSLGEVTPGEAIEIATRWLSEKYDNAKPLPKDLKVRVIGALSIYGHPCYVIRLTTPTYTWPWCEDIAVNADGGSMGFIRGMGGEWRLFHDDNFKVIKCESEQK